MISPNWFVLIVKPQTEKKVAARLKALNIDVFCPMITEIRQWSDRKKKIQVPLFKSYVFVKINDAERHQVFGVPGIVRYLFWLGKPAEVREVEIQVVKDWLNDETVDSITLEKLQPGDNVQIKHGVLARKEAVVERIDKKNVVLTLDGLGLKVRARIRDLI